MGTVEVLRAAKALITPAEKWATGQLCTRDGRMCALGAVMVALHGTDPQNWPTETYMALEEEPAVRVLAKAAGADKYDEGALCDVVFNTNDEGEGAAHHAIVLDLFDRAIALAETE